MPIRGVARITLLGMLLALPSVGCRKEPDRTSIEGDMGDDHVILLPTDSTWVHADLAGSTAEWQPFRNPDEQPPEVERDVIPTGHDTGGAGVENALRDFMTGYDEVVKDTTTADGVDGLLDYYVADQRDALRPVFTVVAALVAADAELRDELEKRLADAPNRLTTADTALREAAPYLLTVASFASVTDTAATADLTPGSLFATCSFVLLDQDWYLKAPEGDALAAAQAAAEAALATREGWLDKLRADAPDVEGVIQAIEATARVKVLEPEGTTAPDGDGTKEPAAKPAGGGTNDDGD